MDLPVLAIPDSMTSQLEAILRENGFAVEFEPSDPEMCLMVLICTDGDVSISLSVHRAGPHNKKGGPVIILSPRSNDIRHPFRHNRQGNELTRRVSEVLQRNGAWIPEREEAT